MRHIKHCSRSDVANNQRYTGLTSWSTWTRFEIESEPLVNKILCRHRLNRIDIRSYPLHYYAVVSVLLFLLPKFGWHIRSALRYTPWVSLIPVVFIILPSGLLSSASCPLGVACTSGCVFFSLELTCQGRAIATVIRNLSNETSKPRTRCQVPNPPSLVRHP